MIRLVVLAAATVVAGLAGCAPAQDSVLGAWSIDDRCGGLMMRMTLARNGMRISDEGRVAFEAAVRYAPSDDGTTITVVEIAPPYRSPRNANDPREPGLPSVGDVLTVRRDGDRLFAVASTLQGEARTIRPDENPLHLCR